MTTLNQYARPEWAAPRKETWYEHLLPQRVTDTINQSPLVGALSKYMNSPTPDLTLPSERDSKVPMPRSPSWFDDRPVATEALDKFGLLANFIGPGAKLPPPAPKPQGIRAYHGSPHDFDRFDMSKIGTGEGAQAYGRGLYFAEAEGVAKNYRDVLSQKKLSDGSAFDDRNPAHWAADAVARAGGDKAKAVELLASDMTPDMRTYEGGQYQRLLRAKAILERGEAIPEMGTGRMYEVKINADPEQFLDWDKPLSQQPEAVRKALEGIPWGEPYVKSSTFTGGQIVPQTKEGVQQLRDAGIPGIKYLDQGSRAAGQGSRNYVVFDDKLIEILRKYGLLPPVAAGAAMAQGQEPPL